MSVTAGRWLLTITAVATVVSLSWFGRILSAIDFEIRQLPGLGFATGTVALAAGATFLITLALTTRFVEAHVEESPASSPGSLRDEAKDPSLRIRWVLRPTRSIPLRAIDDVVVMQHFVLPGRSSASTLTRVVVRETDGPAISFTPRAFGLPEVLQRHGVTVTIDSDRLTPAQAARRYPGSAGIGELATGPVSWLLIVGAIGALVWALSRAAAG